ncbi:zinc carboxypeptidase [Betaproteobacteria bacterium GR16-43]|nr:zinc carboxypeptidase [Betaproteobacteria bacterium GR16-43]
MRNDALRTRTLPELEELDRIIEASAGRARVRTICEVEVDGQRFPVRSIALGTQSPALPALALIGGVHGLERIGTDVILSFLGSLVERLRWDELLNRDLERVGLFFVPIVNPAGMWRGTRANGNGVDLMRNAPVQSSEGAAWLLGGQRMSAHLPWYRGDALAPMEAEAQALCDAVRAELLTRPFSLALDCHSGFGLRDRIWFPHAHTRNPIAHVAEVHALMALYGRSYPNHDYVFEPQCRQYLTHGDLWDYLYLQNAGDPGRIFLPLTLEMGSWRWIKKRPTQLFSRVGIFNPLKEHRHQRVLRRHLIWLEFLLRATASWRQWVPVGEARAQHERNGLANWFEATT